MEELEGTPESTFQAKPHRLDKVRAGIKVLKEKLTPTDTLLDVGCGEGYVCQAIGHENYLGIDAVAKHLERAREINAGKEFLHKNLWELEGLWDVVFCSRVLMHLARFEDAVKKLKSCARKALILIIPIGPKDYLRIDEIDGHKVFYRVFTLERVKATGPSKIVPGQPYSVVIYDIG